MTAKEHLPRLAPEKYRGQAYIHWAMTIQHRRTGWLIPAFHSEFRELLTHTAFRYAITCPIYCLMPDHLHMVWIGIDHDSDQLKASRYFRHKVGAPLEKAGFEFQHQPYDHVLRKKECMETALRELVEYIARNPERQDLVEVEGFRKYEYTGCLVPGYPELELWDVDFWPRFWRTYSFLRENGLMRPRDEKV